MVKNSHCLLTIEAALEQHTPEPRSMFWFECFGLQLSSWRVHDKLLLIVKRQSMWLPFDKSAYYTPGSMKYLLWSSQQSWEHTSLPITTSFYRRGNWGSMNESWMWNTSRHLTAERLGSILVNGGAVPPPHQPHHDTHYPICTPLPLLTDLSLSPQRCNDSRGHGHLEGPWRAMEELYWVWNSQHFMQKWMWIFGGKGTPSLHRILKGSSDPHISRQLQSMRHWTWRDPSWAPASPLWTSNFPRLSLTVLIYKMGIVPYRAHRVL